MVTEMKRDDSADSRRRPRLTVTCQEAEAQISAQIEKGLGLQSMLNSIRESEELFPWDDFRRFDQLYRKWHAYNQEMLGSLFDSDEPAREYSGWGMGTVDYGGLALSMQLETVQISLSDKVAALDSTKEKLRFYEEGSGSSLSGRSGAWGSHVFVVHGHDEAAKQAVARFIEKLGLRAVILHEQPSGGRTVIEKFEEESFDVGYAVVLLTPDDIGAPGDKPEETKRRARQNVVFELGFFVGRLGRARVCVLHKGVVDIPSDFSGVIYVPMDEAGAWQISLAREMKEAGIDIDMNRVL